MKYSWAYPVVCIFICSGCDSSENITTHNPIHQEQVPTTSSAQGNNATTSSGSREVQLPGSQPSTLAHWDQLQMTHQLNELETITDISINNNFQGPPVTQEQFSTWITNATALEPNSKTLKQWHFAPWCDVTFKSASRHWTAQLYLGGLGILNDDNGQSGVFKFDVAK